MPAGEWYSYLEKHGITTRISSFNQEHRKKYLVAQKDSMLTEQIRSDLGLKSSFFSLRQEKEEILFTGKGYGHGVGLCQEGAMAMASSGFSWEEIIHFYFDGVRIISCEAPGR